MFGDGQLFAAGAEVAPVGEVPFFRKFPALTGLYRVDAAAGKTAFGIGGEEFARSGAVFDQGEVLAVGGYAGVFRNEFFHRKRKKGGNGIDFRRTYLYRPFPAAAAAAA